MEGNDSNQELLKKEYERRLQQQEAEKKAEEQIDQLLKTLLDDAAKTRLSNVKLVNKGLYLKAAQAIIYLYRAGKISSKIDEEELKGILSKLNEKREIRIRRK